MVIRKLVVDDYPIALEKYKECISNDLWYQAIKGAVTFDELVQSYIPILKSILNEGSSYGAFEGDELVYYLLAFNVQEWRKKDPVNFKNCFMESDVLVNIFDSYDNPLVFVIGYNDYSANPNMVKMFEQLIKQHSGKNTTFMTDVVKDEASRGKKAVYRTIMQVGFESKMVRGLSIAVLEN